MTEPKNNTSRRAFVKTAGCAAVASVFTGTAIPAVHAAEDNTIRVALVGCGGRGTGAAENAVSVAGHGPIELVAMADVFKDRLDASFDQLQKSVADKMKVPDDRKFLGFDAYKKAMDCLEPGDVVILTTPPAFRWPMFTYAIEKGLNVFMEKPVTVDGPTSKKMLALNEQAKAKNLKVAVGLMNHHCASRLELIKRIRDGAIGDIILMRSYRQTPAVGSCFSEPKPAGMSELEYQIRRFHSFLWCSGGAYSDFNIHNIDECCWMKGEWPVEAKAAGARTYRGTAIDQNFDIYSVEYTFADGAKLFMEGRNIEGCNSEFASYAHGTKNSAAIIWWANTKLFKGQKIGNKADLLWEFPPPIPNSYQLEWNDFIAAIRSDQPYNEVENGVKASLVTSMGRMAAHTGQIITYDQMLNCEHEFAPTVDKLTFDGPAPLQLAANGKYPVPLPGITTTREF